MARFWSSYLRRGGGGGAWVGGEGRLTHTRRGWQVPWHAPPTASCGAVALGRPRPSPAPLRPPEAHPARMPQSMSFLSPGR
jgi:hypothetical protein